MKKVIRISAVITAATLIVWVIASIIYETISHPISDKLSDMPMPYWLSIYIIFTWWVIIGIYSLIKYFNEVKEIVIEFIND